ncbi:hypothetical protein RFI_27983 [Reticulomyxa filosa]|uniref:Uncharacterized protein n=1 Tax=Reticulomyxa filosa TaxID=46433 RepID=X6M5Z3_RETFI|nr:hypothetical protein RFI_27983 [Reticulomyxa filosa]|eukprot:ETO09393.1 hypothetical protein RFI_27983 [Reticulomyxa filosa]
MNAMPNIVKIIYKVTFFFIKTEDLEYVLESIANPTTKAALVSHNIIQILFRFLEKKDQDFAVIVNYIDRTQRNAGQYNVNQPDFFYSFGLQTQKFLNVTLSKFTTNDPELIREICELLAILSFHADSLSVVAKLIKLYQLLNFEDNRIVFAALKCLSEITNIVKNPSEEVISVIVGFLEKYNTEKYNEKFKKAIESTVRCLRNITVNCKSKQTAVEKGAVKVIVKYISLGDGKNIPQICQDCCAILMNVSACISGKKSLIDNKNALEKLSPYSLLEICYSNGEFIIYNLKIFYIYLPVVLFSHCQYRPKLIINLFGVNSSAKIGYHFGINDACVDSENKTYAMRLLAITCKEPNGAKAVWKSLNIIPKLVDIFMLSQNELDVAYALDCIISLCKEISTAAILLQKEAKRSTAFHQTALQIFELKPYL